VSDRLDDYNFHLPPELIAQHPPQRRTDARLLVVDRKAGAVAHHRFRELPDLLDPRDALILNDSKVLPARLVGRREGTGGRWNGLFLEAEGPLWRVIGKTRGRLQPGETIVLEDRTGQDAVRLTLIEAREEGQWIVRPDRDEDAETVLAEIGRVPLPHYIRGGEMEPSDSGRLSNGLRRGARFGGGAHCGTAL
jgi:S-adenosylmethionine:tRNA ribosyltransferase-isomerase